MKWHNKNDPTGLGPKRHLPDAVIQLLFDPHPFPPHWAQSVARTCTKTLNLLLHEAIRSRRIGLHKQTSARELKRFSVEVKGLKFWLSLGSQFGNSRNSLKHPVPVKRKVSVRSDWRALALRNWLPSTGQAGESSLTWTSALVNKQPLPGNPQAAWHGFHCPEQAPEWMGSDRICTLFCSRCFEESYERDPGSSVKNRDCRVDRNRRRLREQVLSRAEFSWPLPFLTSK